ncbi:E3 SUMO-protein ligase KIAA1586-like isoform X3 [Aphis gossypii]|uniref:E3 SUMO-protein ligase KIAA1586-like isoform X3 n=1 Tax=Aphis gossypii TaxID=80765 RepID=UPI0021593135|nr:E3 SUMO-protein ligase KIAA1586-like isoform X3 [Aphis gossypii]
MLSMINQKAVIKNIKETEIRIASFVVEHNIPINVSDHLVNLINSIKLEPKHLAKLTYDRTKCTSIINNVIAATRFEYLKNYLKTNKFSLLVDESTDTSSVKNLAMVVRTCQNFEVSDQFLTLLLVANATADSMYKAITDFFNSYDIPYTINLIGFAADGANAMMGKSHSLQSFLKNDIQELFVMKCVCHSLALCAEYVCRKLPDEVETLIRNIYNFFNHSYKRQYEFKEFQHFFEVNPHKLLQLSCTRWLSLLMVVKRVLEHAILTPCRVED